MSVRVYYIILYYIILYYIIFCITPFGGGPYYVRGDDVRDAHIIFYFVISYYYKVHSSDFDFVVLYYFSPFAYII